MTNTIMPSVTVKDGLRLHAGQIISAQDLFDLNLGDFVKVFAVLITVPSNIWAGGGTEFYKDEHWANLYGPFDVAPGTYNGGPAAGLLIKVPEHLDRSVFHLVVVTSPDGVLEHGTQNPGTITGVFEYDNQLFTNAGNTVDFNSLKPDQVSAINAGAELYKALGGNDEVWLPDTKIIPGTNNITWGFAAKFEGGADNDTVHGGKLDDRISGGTGDDKLFGGAGDDVFFGMGRSGPQASETGKNEIVGSGNTPAGDKIIYGAVIDYFDIKYPKKFLILPEQEKLEFKYDGGADTVSQVEKFSFGGIEYKLVNLQTFASFDFALWALDWMFKSAVFLPGGVAVAIASGTIKSALTAIARVELNHSAGDDELRPLVVATVDKAISDISKWLLVGTLEANDLPSSGPDFFVGNKLVAELIANWKIGARASALDLYEKMKSGVFGGTHSQALDINAVETAVKAMCSSTYNSAVQKTEEKFKIDHDKWDMRGGVKSPVLHLPPDTIPINGEFIDKGAGNNTIQPNSLSNKTAAVFLGGGNDKLSTGSYSLMATGDAGNDTMISGGGKVQFLGGAGNDLLQGNKASDTLFGGAGNDTLKGGSGSDDLHGGAGRDVIYGQSGADVILGGKGGDRMNGGLGADQFVYKSLAERNDTISKFAADDLLVFNGAAFAKLEAGLLQPAFFRSGKGNVALDGNDHFIFRTTDDTLWFDADGKGGLASIKIADLTNDFKLAASDILII